MVIFKGGRNSYGEAIGVILMNKYKARIPGDIGNASTFNFAVRYIVVEEATGTRHRRGDVTLTEPFIKAAQKLEKEGVKAITSACGFLAFFQKEIADSVNIPVFVSSLVQVPMVYSMLKHNQKVGVLTAEGQYLDKRYFEAIGAKKVPVVVYGMENEPEFNRAVIQDGPNLNPELMEQEVVSRCKLMLKENPDVGAIIFECTQLPPYAAAVQKSLNLPIFDIVTLTNMVFDVVARRQYTGFM